MTEPLILSRLFLAPRETVFAAWSRAAHIERWFCPAPCWLLAVEVDFRPGGVFNLHMGLPDGSTHWMRGHFTEIIPPERLVFTAEVSHDGTPGFSVHTAVTFAAEPLGTRMGVRQSYTLLDPEAARSIAGAPEGWRSTLDQLAAETARLSALLPPTHGSFTLHRRLSAPLARVYRAFTDIEAKARWFHGGPDYTLLERTLDLRPGGREIAAGRWPGGMVSRFTATYYDIAPEIRLVYAYEMHLDGVLISVSLATLAFQAEDAGTRLSVTEQGVFLNGYADNGAREHGTADLLDRLAASLTS